MAGCILISYYKLFCEYNFCQTDIHAYIYNKTFWWARLSWSLAWQNVLKLTPCRSSQYTATQLAICNYHSYLLTAHSVKNWKGRKTPSEGINKQIGEGINNKQTERCLHWNFLSHLFDAIHERVVRKLWPRGRVTNNAIKSSLWDLPLGPRPL